MRIKLVLHDWMDRDQNSVYSTEKGIELTMGSFHHGTTFEADLDLRVDDLQELKEAMEAGYTPVFYVVIEK